MQFVEPRWLLIVLKETNSSVLEKKKSALREFSGFAAALQSRMAVLNCIFVEERGKKQKLDRPGNCLFCI